MICKRITNFGGENRIKEFDKYEFEINIVSKKESIDNNVEKTIIVVEDEMYIDNVVDSITHSINFPGLITTSIADLYEIFHNSGVWNFKHIIKNRSPKRWAVLNFFVVFFPRDPRGVVLFHYKSREETL